MATTEGPAEREPEQQHLSINELEPPPLHTHYDMDVLGWQCQEHL